MTPWHPLAGQVVEPVVHFGGGEHGLTHNSVVSHWLPGTGSWAPLTGSIGCSVRGVGSMVALGRQPRPCTQEAPAVSSVDRDVQHATAVNP